MKISSVAFKSTFIVDRENTDSGKFNSLSNLTSPETAIYHAYDLMYPRAHIVTKDEFDDIIESYLVSNNIKFVRKTNEELMDKEALISRSVVPNNDYETPIYMPEPVFVDVKKFDEAYRDTGFYIRGYNDLEDSEKVRIDNVVKYMHSGLPIKLPEVFIRVKEGKPEVNFKDGRHRYAVIRDMGFDTIPLAMDEESYKIAGKMGLIKEKA